jgi:predicted hydrolase (HD superfamily)
MKVDYMITRVAALALLSEYTKTESLLRHAFCVEASMLFYADHFGIMDLEKELWGITGLVHDFDYEQNPNCEPPDGHPFFGVKILKEHKYPEAVIDAILGHAEYTNTERVSQLSKTLYAVDELSGLVLASALVRPDKSIHTLEASSVKKRFKDKAFSRGCDRESIKKGAEDLGIALEVHFANIISALQRLDKKMGEDSSHFAGLNSLTA